MSREDEAGPAGGRDRGKVGARKEERAWQLSTYTAVMPVSRSAVHLYSPKESGHVPAFGPIIRYTVQPREQDMAGHVKHVVLLNERGQLLQ